jgi:Protein NO VEIN, C-terminal
VKAVGRPPTDDEKWLLATRSAPSGPAGPAPAPGLPVSAPSSDTEFPEVVAKWRTAELAVLDWLNSRGWQLTDVSKQNLGYDLVGLGPDGDRMMIEIKRVARPDARFAMTNNEMGALQSEAGSYLLGIVVGEGRYSRFMLLDPNDKAVPRERVCRAWEWQFLDWSRHGTYLN